jgi:phage tail protein X
MWDSISRRVYNSENMMHLLIDANLGYRDVVVFPANCELMIPDTPRGARVTFPPWRANA